MTRLLRPLHAKKDARETSVPAFTSVALRTQSRTGHGTLAGVVTMLLAVLLAYCRSLEARIDAADPCNPNRKFCGRITITIMGAGTMGEKATRDSTLDITSEGTKANFLQFSREDAGDGQALSMVIASDPELTASLNNLPSEKKEIAGLLGITSTSRPAFQKFLSNDVKLSLLQRAIEKLSANKDCQDLMKKEGHDSVLPLLKAEIVIQSENVNSKIPAWSNENESGSIDQWYENPDHEYIDKNLMQQLRAKLGEAAVQTFVAACNGTNIAEHMETVDQCSCYFSSTDDQTLLHPHKTYSSFGSTLKNNPSLTTASLSQSQPQLSRMVSMTPMILTTNFQGYKTYSQDGVGVDPIFVASNRINPLQSFALNSADYKAEKALFNLLNHNIAPEAADKLLKAGFSEGLPPKINLSADEIARDPDLERILDTTAKMRNLYAPHTKDIKINPSGGFKTAMNAFGNCMRRKNPKPKACSSLFQIGDLASQGTGGEGKQTQEDRELLAPFNKFLHDYDSLKGPDLVARYTRGEININELFVSLNTLWKEFDQFRQAITSFANNYYHGSLPPNLKTAFKAMKTNYQMAFMAVQDQFFPLMKKGVLEVRLVRIEEAAKLLHIHKNDLPNSEGRDELRQMGNDLVCLTNYPVGPAFDKLNFSSARSPLLTIDQPQDNDKKHADPR